MKYELSQDQIVKRKAPKLLDVLIKTKRVYAISNFTLLSKNVKMYIISGMFFLHVVLHDNSPEELLV